MIITTNVTYTQPKRIRHRVEVHMTVPQERAWRHAAQRYGLSLPDFLRSAPTDSPEYGGKIPAKNNENLMNRCERIFSKEDFSTVLRERIPMLALKLRPTEVIHLGDHITLYAGTEVTARGVQIGIEAPPEVVIWREKIVSTKRRHKGPTMKIMPLDPGIIATGWSVLEDGCLLDYGVLRPDDAKADVPQRLDSLCAGLEALLEEYRPNVILIELCSGHLNEQKFAGKKQGQIGARLAVLGQCVGELRRTEIHWAVSGGEGEVIAIPENTWTRRQSKEARAWAMKMLFPELPDPATDSGLHVHDSCGLAVWWSREQKVRSLADV